MPKIQYKKFAFEPSTLKIIQVADTIVGKYQAQGFDLTLRQLYYQFVAKGIIPNSQKEYTKLSSIINDARLAGLLDWKAIVDRTRNMRSLQHWQNPESTVARMVGGYQEDLWKDQTYRVEVWIEKDALAGILDAVCPALDVPYFSCRGYTSQSEMWVAAQRIIRHAKEGQHTIILHLGDHDPSGIDMSRDIKKRLTLFTQKHLGLEPVFTIRRIALNWKQIETYHPPPNWAKVTDSRFKKYQEQFGQHSWELDALDPEVLVRLIKKKIRAWVDVPKMEAAIKQQELSRQQLQIVSENWQKALDACGAT